MANINKDFQHVPIQPAFDFDDLDASMQKPSLKIGIASFHGQPSDDGTVLTHRFHLKELICSQHIYGTQCNQNRHDTENDFTLIKPDKDINRNFETNIDVHSSENAGHNHYNGKISNHNAHDAVFQCDEFADRHEGKLSKNYDNEQGQHCGIETAEKGKPSLFSGNEQKCVNCGPNKTFTYILNTNPPETVPTVSDVDIGHVDRSLGAKRQVLKFSNYNRRLLYDKGKDCGTFFIFKPGVFILIILCSVSTTSAAKCQFAGKEVLQKDNNLIMVICYTCSGNERWDNGTTYLHLNGPNGTNIMQGSYDIESNGSCSMLTIKDAKPKDYVQQYQFTKGTTPITISPLSSPILSNQHIESCVDGLESYELNLTVKHNSEEAVFHVTEPKVDLIVTKMEIVPGFYESKIHMLYRQNGNTSTTNESSNGQNVTIQLLYTIRKDTDIILTKQIADLKCPLLLPGITEDASSTLIYILLPLVCIVMIVVVVIIYCKWEWIKIKFRKFRKKEPAGNDDNELEHLQTNEANSSNASANNQNGTITVHQNGIN